MDILSKLAVLLDNENSLGICIREVMSRKAESIESAEHTKAFNTAHLALLYLTLGENSSIERNGNEVALFYVFSICNYLDRSVRADVYLTNKERVCIFMLSL